ncbi:recombinase family protein [Ileibacterium valens]|uniref:recombinase family protein n=1 Tax=Ileibacterium valens TaxID=1862668 RepID=UPI002573578B|nr:recombinase family protein [Ileibacterium valens]
MNRVQPMIARKNVAAYARVSTDRDEQQSSYETQVSYYENMIRERADWNYVNVYTNESISSTSTAHREGFRRMIDDALHGKIDLIITKSVSRFARNTVDSLTTIRELKEHHVEVFFEKENIWTFDGKGEQLLTIMSSLVHEESRSISENVKWGVRKKYEEETYRIPYGNLMGYTRAKDGGLKIVEEEAKIVRLIFRMFLNGSTYTDIKNHLESQGIKTKFGRDKWDRSVIKQMLMNEKYKGDLILQKIYAPDFITKKQVKNNGAIPSYYVTNSHQGIISTEDFDRVQKMIADRKYRYGKERLGCHTPFPFSHRVQCATCKSWYTRSVATRYAKKKVPGWICWKNKYDSDQRCPSHRVPEAVLEQEFVNALNELLKDKQNILDEWADKFDETYNTEKLQAKADRIQERMEKIAEKAEKLIEANPSNFNKAYTELLEEYEKLEKGHAKLAAKIKDTEYEGNRMRNYLELLQKLDHVDDFDGDLVRAMVDKVMVYKNRSLELYFVGKRRINRKPEQR